MKTYNKNFVTGMLRAELPSGKFSPAEKEELGKLIDKTEKDFTRRIPKACVELATGYHEYKEVKKIINDFFAEFTAALGDDYIWEPTEDPRFAPDPFDIPKGDFISGVYLLANLIVGRDLLSRVYPGLRNEKNPLTKALGKAEKRLIDFTKKKRGRRNEKKKKEKPSKNLRTDGSPR